MSEAQNPYQAPHADLGVDAEAIRSGNIEQTLAGRGHLDIGEVMGEAWRRTKGVKRILFGGLLLFNVALSVLMFLITPLLGMGGGVAMMQAGSGAGFVQLLVFELVLMSLVYPFLAGVNLTAARHASGLRITFNGLFAHYGKMLPLLGAGLLIAVLTAVGTIFLVIPGIYLSIAYLSAPILIVDRGMGIWQAMETSRKLVTKHWFTVFFLLLVVGILVCISSLLLIPLIWTFPWFVLCIGLVYRNLAGVHTR